MVDIETKLSKNKNQKIVARDTRKLRSNPGKFVVELSKVDWSFINNHHEDIDVDLLEEYLTKSVLKVLDKLAPFKTRILGQRKRKHKSEKILVAEKKLEELQQRVEENNASGQVDKNLAATYRKHKNYCSRLHKKFYMRKMEKLILLQRVQETKFGKS